MTRQAISPRFAIRILPNMAALLPQTRQSGRDRPTQAAARFSRNAPMPSTASGVARMRAMRCAVSSTSSSVTGRLRDGADQLLGGRLRLRSPGEERLEDLADPAVERIRIGQLVDEPQLERARSLDP